MKAILEEYGSSIIFILLMSGCCGILLYILTVVSQRAM